jgi:hypothetical protein
MKWREPRPIRKNQHKFHVKPQHLAELRKFVEDNEIDQVADDMREIIEREMPDLVHKLPPRR